MLLNNFCIASPPLYVLNNNSTALNPSESSVQVSTKLHFTYICWDSLCLLLQVSTGLAQLTASWLQSSGQVVAQQEFRGSAGGNKCSVPRKTRGHMASKALYSMIAFFCDGEKGYGWSRTDAQEQGVRITVGGNGVLFTALATFQLLCWRFPKSIQKLTQEHTVKSSRYLGWRGRVTTWT